MLGMLEEPTLLFSVSGVQQTSRVTTGTSPSLSDLQFPNCKDAILPTAQAHRVVSFRLCEGGLSCVPDIKKVQNIIVRVMAVHCR